MAENWLAPPVLLIVFKRADTASQVFQAIRAARPSRLFIAADGPRDDRPGEAEQCSVVRSVVSQVDWPCQLQTLFRPKNVGIKRHISEAITWFLEQAGEGIILEDDCLPSQDFFEFAATMLEYYRTESRVMHISGSCFQPVLRGDASYFFSRYNHGWGWATWRRAWQAFDMEMSSWPAFSHNAARNGFWLSSRERRYWSRIFDEQAAGLIDTWDYQWKFTLWKEDGVAVYPNFNMVSNLGFNDDGTNTLSYDGMKGERAWQSPVRDKSGGWLHPTKFLIDRVADKWTFTNLYWGTSADRWRARLQKFHRWVKE